MAGQKIDKKNVETILTLSPMQEGFLVHYLKNPGSEEYFEQLSLNITGTIDIDVFKRAWNFVVETNEMLRTVFIWEQVDKPIQVILKRIQIPIEIIDLSLMTQETEKQRFLQDLKEKDRNAKFDLRTGPLLRIYLCKLEEGNYEMMISNHHIIYDGWSNGIILNEFFDSYHQLELGQNPLKVVKNKYQEYLKWMQKLDSEKQKKYWKGYLQGFDGKTALPVDMKKETDKLQINKYICKLSTNMITRLKNLTRNYKVTEGLFFYIIWGILLQKCNNIEDVVFGTTVAGRPTEIQNIDKMIGLFINTIPLRIRASGDEKVSDLMNKIQIEMQERQQFENTSLVDIYASSETNLLDGLFDSLVVIENYPLVEILKTEGLRINSYSAFEQTDFDLTLQITTFNDFELTFAYNQTIFELATIKRMSDHYLNIINEVLANPDIKIVDISMISPEEKEQILYGFNDTKVDFPQDQTIHRLFEEQAVKCADEIAVVYQEKHLTYRELNEKANQLARLLREKGVDSNHIIGIMVDRSCEMMIGIMGILKAGGAYLPIDPKYPNDRIKFLLDDTKTNIVLTQSHYIHKISFEGSMIDLEAKETYQGDSTNLRETARPQDLAYVLYTSGTTGQPKGVMIEQGSVVNLVTGLRDNIYYQYGPSLRVCLLAPYVFDASVQQIFSSLLLGHSLYIVPDEVRMSGKELLDFYYQNSIDISDGTPAHISLLLNAMAPVEKIPVKHYIIGGEALSSQTVVKFLDKFTIEKPNVTNIYGPAECCVDTTAYLVNIEEVKKYSTVPIGFPLANKRIYILDKNQKPVPIGVMGEIYISGEGLARGYYNSPDLTAGKFIPNPFEPGRKMYKTGDLARWLSSGNIEFLGRTDFQVKVRGYRIELGEIEAQLLNHADINECIVIGREDEGGNKYLCAYLVMAKDVSVADLRKHLLQKLPEYMIPSYFVKMDELPKTINGKINRKALPAPEKTMKIGTEYVAPENEVEEKLTKIWSDILKIEKIGIDDNFFELGGHSLRATTVVSRVFKELNVEIPLSQIFTTPTIRGLAKIIQSAQENSYTAIKRVYSADYYALSSAQKRLFLLNQIDKNNTNYNMPAALMIEGDLDVEKMEAAFRTLIHRHESLRTSFEFVGGEPVQHIHDHVELNFEYIVLDHHIKDFAEAENQLKELMIKFIQPFDLSTAPLLRVGLIKVSDQHVLLFDIHHIISDGTSINILIREIVNLYKGNELPNLRMQYKDFSAWQNDVLRTDGMNRQEKYWLDLIAGEVPVLNLPTDFPRPAVMTYEGNKIKLAIGEELTASLKQLAQQQGATMYMVLLAAYNILLSNYSGQEDIIVGSPIAGRHHADTEDTVGMFVNTLVMRNFPRSNRSFIDFLADVRQRSLKAYENQDYQFEMLVEKLELNRDLSRNVLFDVMFVLQNTEHQKYALDGLKISSYHIDNKITKFDLTLLAEEQAAGIELTLEYRTKLFKADTIQRMIGHFENILQRIVDNPQIQLAEIELSSAVERNQVLFEFNDTHAEYQSSATLHELFEEQVDRTPNHIALVYKDAQMTYEDFNQKSNQLAHRLAQMGIKQDHVVGIMVDRSFEMMIGIMGILKAGGAYLPIDPEYPEDRIAHMLKDSQTKVLLTQQHLKQAAEKLDYAGEIIDLNDQDTYVGDGNNLESRTGSEGLAYIIYTSGSTGKPKGVMIEHQSAVNTLQYLYRTYPFTESDRYLLKTAYTFDVSVSEVFGWFMGNGRLIIAEKGVEKDPKALVEMIEKYRVTHINFVPSMLSILLNTLNAEEMKELRSLKYVFAAGEALSRNLVEKFYGMVDDVVLENLYGPTEAAIYATKYALEDLGDKATVPIGKPLANVHIYILNREGKPQPIGVVGELFIAGAGVARGYLNREELTAERFVADPYRIGRMYKTGDLARWLPDGNIEYFGRIDQQVKIRGFRIELGEIENQLRKDERIQDAVVVDRTDESQDKYLCAYIVTKEDLSVSEIKDKLAMELPDYMIPTYFVKLEQLPMTTSGKVNRKALPQPDGSIGVGTEYAAPANEIEEKLAVIWSEVLGVKKIGMNDNFMELGGHSLKAMAVVSKIFKELKVKISLGQILKTSTIRGLAGIIRSAHESIYTEIQPVEPADYYALSSAQKRLLLLNQIENQNTSYNMPGALWIEGDLNVEKMESAFRSLIQRHESLRTSFEFVEGEPVQRIHENVQFNFDYIDFGDHIKDFAEAENQIAKIIKEFVKPFDLSTAPLLRVGLIKVLDQHVLIFDMHHIISDGTSMNILKREIANLYEGNELPNLRIQYKDFSAWQNDFLQSETMHVQEKYWLDLFAEEVPVLNMPTDFPRPAVMTYAGDKVKFAIGEELTASLNQFAQEQGATMYMVLLAAYNVLLAKYTGQEDIIVGSPTAGRRHADIENIIGMFVNTLAMRNFPLSDRSFKEFVADVRDRALHAYENQDYQFEMLVDKLELKRDLSRNALFDVMFVLQNTEHQEYAFDGFKMTPYDIENKITKFDLLLMAEENDAKMEVTLEYRTHLFTRSKIQRMAEHFTNILQSVVENPNIQLAAIDILSKAERDQLLVEFNDTKVEYPKSSTVHQLFEQQVDQTPDAMAVVYDQQSLTYRELNQRANQLARLLRDKGVRPDQAVGIMVDKSIEMIIGVLGIIKAGGAYLPIDVDYPEKRIEYMLQDAEIKHLLIQQGTDLQIDFDGETIAIDDQQIYCGDDFNLPHVNHLDDLIYIIYTSGSTGNPKGVMIQHQNVNRLIMNSNMLIVDKTDRILQTGSLAFDASTFEIWGSLLNGATLYLIPKDELLSAEKFNARLKEYHISVIWLTAPLFNQMVEENVGIFSELRTLIVGGDALSPKHINKVRARYADLTIINGYGPTESTTFTTYFVIDEEYKHRIPIGKPVSNTQVYIVNKSNQLAPIGVDGEICIGGDGLARGYLNRPELTARSFVENPFAAAEKMYRTGDLGRWLPDGNVEFSGRIDHQVKIRGFRIEPGEIEKQLVAHPLLKEAVVLDLEDANGNKYLCGYFVAETDLAVADLRKHLSKTLPDYMIPSYFVKMNELPKTLNGKINRNALPEPDKNLKMGTEYVAPENEVEVKLAKIWSEILGVETIGVYDNFFELGGHSLRATTVVSKVFKELNVELSLGQIFKTPTIRGLAEIIRSAKESIYTDIEPVNDAEYYAVSSAQKRLLLLNQIENSSTSYNMPGALLIEGDVDVEKMESAFSHLIQRHESLRTSFEFVEGEPVQRIHEHVEFKFDYLVLGNHLNDFQEAKDQLREMIKEYIRPFDLRKAPLLRAGLIKVLDQHVLIFDMHHIISDGTSMNILQREIANLYEGNGLPDLRVQYKDFSAWQNDFLKSEKMNDQERYWLGLFAGEVPVLNMPIDFPRPAVMMYEGDKLTFEIGEELTASLNQLAQEQGATLYMTLLAAYNVLLSKYSGQEDIIVGSPIAGRAHPDVENMIGMFVNTLAMRNFPVSDRSYADFLADVKDRALQAFENQDYQFEMLVEKLDLKRDLSRNALFDVMFVLQNTEHQKYALSGLKMTPYDIENNITKFDLTLMAEEQDSKVVFTLEYCTRLFERGKVQRISEHFTRILQSIVEHPNIQLAEMDLLSNEERDQLLEFTNTKVEYPKSNTIQELFEEQVNKTPDAIAVVYNHQSLTYRELNQRANQLARLIREKGVGPDQAVGLMVDKSIEMIIGVLGIIKAGGAYLPIDVDYPAKRVEYMLKDADLNLLLIQQGTVLQIDFTGETIEIDDQQVYCGDDSNLPNVNHRDDLIYIMYTSGSTGNPKGVMIQHQNVNRLIMNSNMLIVDKTDRILQTGSLAFDASTFEIWGSLLNGATLYLIPKDELLSAEKFNARLKEYHISMIWLTAPLFNQMVEENVEIFSELKTLIVGGDALSPKHINKVRARYADLTVINGYGPTESTTFATYFVIDEEYKHNIPIGKPVSNTQIYILNQSNQFAPIGVDGEICIGGDGLARGYLNRPELTARNFVENPFAPAEKMYRTGDLGRWLPNGTIEFSGRIDHQVKIRGFRIEPGEIEKQLLEHPSMKETIVLDLEDANGSKYLCGYFVAETDLSIADLRKHLAKTLPDYMIPTYFVALTELPKTLNGKINRQALPAPDTSMKMGTEYVAPDNEIEEKLAKIWSDILGIERIGVYDDFFELGGHSLRATTVVSRVFKEMNVELSLGQIFKTPTIRGLAEIIRSANESLYLEIKPVALAEYYAVSSAQKRLLLLDQIENSTTSYNMPGALLIKGDVDAEKMESAFRKLIDRHESLRTSFELVEGEPVQRIHETVEFNFDYMVLDHHLNDLSEADDQLAEMMKGFIRPFDLNKAPLLRAGLIKGLDHHVLIFDMHHIISDGTSMNILQREIASLYEGTELPDLRIQYKDFSAWQNDFLRSEKMNDQERYWLNLFAGEVPVLNMPIDFPRPATITYEGDKRTFEIGETLTAGLNRLAQQHGATLFMTLLAAYNILLSKYSGQEDIIVGSPIAGRPHPDVENIIGMFVNTMAMRNFPVSDRSFADFLGDVRDRALQAYENQDYQFEVLVEKLDLNRDLSRNALFDVMFVLQNTEHQEFALHGLTFAPFNMENKISKFDLILSAEEKDARIELALGYRTKLFTENTIQRMVGHFVNIIQGIVDDPSVKLAEIELLSNAERNMLLVEFNDTHAEYRSSVTLHELFEEQVKRTPNHIALVYQDAHMTYAELNRRSNQVANRLSQMGITHDQIIGIMVDRSFEMMIGVMGILKAGGAYLPIDPDYPEERITHMLTDSQAGVLLTQNHLMRIAETFDFVGTIIDLNDDAIYIGDGCNRETITRSHDLAYVIYTSGSTGRPKGVMVEHQSAVNTLQYLNSTYPFTESDAYLLKTSYTFDVSVSEIFGWFMGNGRLVIAEKGVEREPKAIVEVIEKYRVTHINFVPSMLNILLNALNEEEIKVLSRLKYVFVAGEALPKNVVEKFYSMVDDVIFENLYGPTEAAIYATKYALEDVGDQVNVPIGKPLANVQIYILSREGKLQPIGVAGELFIAGSGVARGYLNRTELTEERFVADPFRGGKMYKTGDLARWMPDGNIEYLGRIDHQVKIRGFRIELGEIENQLRKDDRIQEAVVVDRTDENQDKYLCAYIVTTEELSVSEIKEKLAVELPEYMIPTYFVRLEQLPMTTSGKIDRKALPEPDGSVRVGTEYAAPRNELEEQLVEIWSEILGVKQIGIDDNFFESGGHSLKAAEVVGLVHKKCQIEIKMKNIFQNPTIRQLASFCQTQRMTTYQEIVKIPEQECYELSYSQKRLWIINQLDQNSSAYNMPGRITLHGEIKEELITQTLQTLIQRHESLRTSFKIVNGKPAQIVEEDPQFALRIIDLTEVSEVDVHVSREQIYNEESARVFDLTVAPLINACLIKVHNDEADLVFSMHHIISDGWSFEILKKEFYHIYEKYQAEQDVELEPLPIQYRDFAAWQNQLLSDAAKMSMAKEYWMKQIGSDLPLLDLPVDYPKATLRNRESAGYRIVIPAEILEQLKEIAQNHQASLFMILLAGFNLFLSQLTGQNDFVIGIPAAGREHANLKNVIGFFINTLIVRTQIDPTESLSEFLNGVQDNTLKALGYQYYPLELILDELHLSYPTIPVFFNMLNMGDSTSEQLDDLTSYHTDSVPEVKFDIACYLQEYANGIVIHCHYLRGLFEPTTMEVLMGKYVSLLESIVKNPNLTLKEYNTFRKGKKMVRK